MESLYPQNYEAKKGSATWRQSMRGVNKQIADSPEGTPLSSKEQANRRKAVKKALSKVKGSK